MKSKRWLVAAGVVMAGLCLADGRAVAQGGGGNFGPGGGFNYDPAQFQQQMQEQMMQNYRERLSVPHEDEWNVIEPRIQKVLDARRETGFGGLSGMVNVFSRGGGSGAGPGGGERGGGRRGLFGSAAAPSPEEEALTQAVATNAPNTVLKATIAQVQEARKAKQAKLEAAQEELRQVLSIRQEAIAVTLGLL